ncbi:MAG: uroporphyrinogen-III synthase [Bacteroidales bacterium]|nr:uroporphyrinogen-III synthase [Bacteroidales bacterium]
MKVKSLLISQPKPATKKSPYFDLAEKHRIKIDFYQFIRVEGISGKEFRANRININDFSAIIFTSRTAIDHFFRVCEEVRVRISDLMKYFCTSESIAVYLQKYIVYRKRKIFYGTKHIRDLVEVLVKHKGEKYLVPVSDIHKDEIPDILNTIGIDYTIATFYRTVSTDLSHLDTEAYDMFVFYSPAGIESLYHNFPDFKQGNKFISTFGAKTAKAAKAHKLRIDLQVPSPEFPSMTMALDDFITRMEKKG